MPTRQVGLVACRIAGVITPAFVERRGNSPGRRWDWPRIAGVITPAFVERPGRPVEVERAGRASPGSSPRPSLSVRRGGVGRAVPQLASPGSSPRPSLSDWRLGGGRTLTATGIAGVITPAFVERARRCRCSTGPDRRIAGVITPAFVERARPRCQAPGPAAGIAGVITPAFVERSPTSTSSSSSRSASPGSSPRPSLSVQRLDRGRHGHRASPGSSPRPSLSARPGDVLPPGRDQASPGSSPRPSLSVPSPRRILRGRGRIAGVITPAFVERLWRAARSFCRFSASPGSSPRPSLSERPEDAERHPGGASPGSSPRPSLSDQLPRERCPPGPRIAGVITPAFVERRWPGGCCRRRPGRIAGVITPAFVERAPVRPALGPGLPASPGSSPRPSLSVQPRWTGRRHPSPASPGSSPRPSLSVCILSARLWDLRGIAGVITPAFVERSTRGSSSRWPASHRRGHHPGLR